MELHSQSISSNPSIADGIGSTIARLRRRAGKTLPAFAGELGMSVDHLAEIEAGTREIHLDDVDPLSAALGIAPHELFSA